MKSVIIILNWEELEEIKKIVLWVYDGLNLIFGDTLFYNSFSFTYFIFVK